MILIFPSSFLLKIWLEKMPPFLKKKIQALEVFITVNTVGVKKVVE